MTSAKHLDRLAMIAATARDVFSRECSPDVVSAASTAGEWSEPLWRTLQEVGLSSIGADGSREEALAVVSIAASFAAPVPIAETTLAHLLAPDLGEGCFSVATRGRAAYGRYAERILGADEQPAITQDINYAGEPWDRIHPAGFSGLLPLAALVRSHQMAGALERVLELTVEYAHERHQFGRPIAAFQAVQHSLARLAEEVAAARAAADEAAIAGTDNAMAIAKIRCGDAVATAVPLAHQLHGAIGMTEEHVLQHFTRRLWSWRDDFGMESEWASWLGARLDPTSLWEVTCPGQTQEATN